MEPDGSFSDRRDRLFGRAPDIAYLLDRTKRPGLTAVTGRPKMGKTWLLEETARGLEEKGHLVGYHECKGQTSDLLLRTVADLYSRWLSRAGFLQQAKSLWGRHKDKLMTAAAQAVGRLIEGAVALGAPPFQKVGELARESFDALARANKELKTGGLDLSPLDYDQALELVRILSDVSQAKLPLILILDAWEKSASSRFEHDSLSLFLSHITDWPDMQVILGLRYPDYDNPQHEDVVGAYAEDLANASAFAAVYELPGMHLTTPQEEARTLSSLRHSVEATRSLSAPTLIKLIDGFPGVVDQWLAEAKLGQLQTTGDLRQSATNAQTYRYREFDRLFRDLTSDQRAIAVRVAIFPRLDADTWPFFEQIVLGELPSQSWLDLCANGVLEGGPYPSYGHDTRLIAACRWFITRQAYQPTVRQEAEGLIFKLARSWRSDGAASRPIVEQLVLLGNLHEAVGLSTGALALCEGSRYLFEGPHLDPGQGPSTAGLRTALNQTPDIAALVAQILVNASASRFRSDSADNIQQGISDMTDVLRIPGVPDSQKAGALNLRGLGYIIRTEDGDLERALADFAAAMLLTLDSTKQRTNTVLGRTIALAQTDNDEGTAHGITDMTSLLEEGSLSRTQRCEALTMRALFLHKRGGPEDLERSIADLECAGSITPLDWRRLHTVLYHRALFYLLRDGPNDKERAVEDLTELANMPDLPATDRIDADLKLAELYRSEGPQRSIDRAIAAYAVVINMKGAAAAQQAIALLSRAVAYDRRGHPGDVARAITDFTTVIDMPDIPDNFRSIAQAALPYLQTPD